MKIPVFVSCPTTLNKSQAQQKSLILDVLDSLNLEPRALGKSDYPSDLPLREVKTIARHCSGGVILGFTQFIANGGTWKDGTSKKSTTIEQVRFPSEWNNLEAGILFSLNRPLLVFRENGISGGVFDPGVTDVFIHEMPNPKSDISQLREIFLKWRDKVGSVYYSL